MSWFGWGKNKKTEEKNNNNPSSTIKKHTININNHSASKKKNSIEKKSSSSNMFGNMQVQNKTSSVTKANDSKIKTDMFGGMSMFGGMDIKSPSSKSKNTEVNTSTSSAFGFIDDSTSNSMNTTDTIPASSTTNKSSLSTINKSSIVDKQDQQPEKKQEEVEKNDDKAADINDIENKLITFWSNINKLNIKENEILKTEIKLENEIDLSTTAIKNILKEQEIAENNEQYELAEQLHLKYQKVKDYIHKCQIKLKNNQENIQDIIQSYTNYIHNFITINHDPLISNLKEKKTNEMNQMINKLQMKIKHLESNYLKQYNENNDEIQQYEMNLSQINNKFDVIEQEIYNQTKSIQIERDELLITSTTLHTQLDDLLRQIKSKKEEIKKIEANIANKELEINKIRLNYQDELDELNENKQLYNQKLLHTNQITNDLITQDQLIQQIKKKKKKKKKINFFI